MAPTVTRLDKCALLLSQLDAQSLDKVLEMLGPEFAGKLKPVLSSVARRKDFQALSEQILQEFRDLQTEVRASVAPVTPESRGSTQSMPSIAARAAALAAASTNAAAQATASAPTSSASAAPGSPRTPGMPPGPAMAATPAPGASPAARPANPASNVAAPSEPMSLAATSLAEFSPPVLSAALKMESPRMVATLLQQLPADTAGKVLESLPPELRQSVFLLMADPARVPDAVVARVIERLVEVCRTIDPATADPQDRRIKSLIGILQSVEREERLRLMESLTQHDPQLAMQLDNSLYDYSDLLRIEDRSLQKLLSQLEQRVVATALKTAPEDLRQKVFKNLSERVRLALNEEMDLLSGLTNSKVDAARQEIAGVIRNQDKEGALVWIE